MGIDFSNLSPDFDEMIDELAAAAKDFVAALKEIGENWNSFMEEVKKSAEDDS